MYILQTQQQTNVSIIHTGFTNNVCTHAVNWNVNYLSKNGVTGVIYATAASGTHTHTGTRLYRRTVTTFKKLQLKLHGTFKSALTVLVMGRQHFYIVNRRISL